LKTSTRRTSAAHAEWIAPNPADWMARKPEGRADVESEIGDHIAGEIVIDS
jgi:hypothetical protein